MGWVWNRHAPTFFLSHEQCTRPIEKITDMCLHFFYGSCVLFMEPTNMDFSKFFFKIGSYGTIYIFKNYFITIFLIFNNKQYPNRSQWDYFFYDLTSWNCRVILRHKCRQFNALVVSEYFRNFSFTSFHAPFFFFWNLSGIFFDILTWSFRRIHSCLLWNLLKDLKSTVTLTKKKKISFISNHFMLGFTEKIETNTKNEFYSLNYTPVYIISF